MVQCEVSADLLCRKYWAERGQGEHKSARALKRENVKRESARKASWKKKGDKCGVRCERGGVM